MDKPKDEKFACFLEALKRSGLDDAAQARAFHHSAVDPREWKRNAADMERLKSLNDRPSR